MSELNKNSESSKKGFDRQYQECNKFVAFMYDKFPHLEVQINLMVIAYQLEINKDQANGGSPGEDNPVGQINWENDEYDKLVLCLFHGKIDNKFILHFYEAHDILNKINKPRTTE